MRKQKAKTIVEEAFNYDLSKVPPRFRAQFGADLMAALRHAPTTEARNNYINGMLRAYEVIFNDEQPKVYAAEMVASFVKS